MLHVCWFSVVILIVFFPLFQEQERLKYEQQEAEKKELRDQYIAKILNPPSTVNSVAVAPLLSSSSAYQKEVAKPVGENTSLNTSNKATSNHDR